MDNVKTIFPIGLSLLIAVAGSFFIYRWINEQTATTKVVKVKSDAVPIAVAAFDMKWGDVVRLEMLKTAPYLKPSIPKGSFLKPEEVVGRVLISPVKKGEPLLEHRLAPVTVVTGGVAVVLEAGRRAVAVKGDKVIGLSGLVNPGNRVDVLVTVTHPDLKKEKTKTILENLLVLATGTQIETNDKGEPSPVDVYTLEVSPEEAEKLALAAAEGKLQFALRNHTDLNSVATAGVTIPQILGSGEEEVVSVKSTETSVPKTVRVRKRRNRYVSVEIIKGVDVSKTRLKTDEPRNRRANVTISQIP